jgi:hypothetical protein
MTLAQRSAEIAVMRGIRRFKSIDNRPLRKFYHSFN